MQHIIQQKNENCQVRHREVPDTSKARYKAEKQSGRRIFSPNRWLWETILGL